MYTGVVEATGEVTANERTGDGRRLRVALDAADITSGESIAVSGVCLTAERVGDGWFEAFLSEETVARTNVWEAGTTVNLERPLALDDRLHGHVMKGTVDAVTEVVGIEQRGEGWWFEFAMPAAYAPYFVEKGAVALDGISLTVASLTDETFAVAVVPATYERTTLSEMAVGDRLNVEVDILAKYVERQHQSLQ
ncbi:riboflavin synthase [Halocatena marina]|uniref:Riboflavin synthase n=1 Tax=Halocatena marina TaxID=2934937 RepID=A0ABD5YUK6_9EURY|nr:riboflavin synthase [Halocatena marina]